METSLKNVPPHLTDDDLLRETRPHMEALGIENWTCSKPRRKPHAWIWFPKPGDGVKFLQAHGMVEHAPETKPSTGANGSNANRPNQRRNYQRAPRKAATAQLHITGTPVFVEKSRRSTENAIPSAVPPEKLVNQSVSLPDRRSQSSNLAFSITSIACGKNVFDDLSADLTFAQQSQLEISCTGTITRRGMSLVTSGLFRMDFPLETIQDFVAGYETSTVNLVLSEPPRIFAMINQGFQKAFPKWERRSHCPGWPDHSKYVAHCLVYRLSILSRTFQTMLPYIRRRDLISVTQHNLPVDKTPEPFVHDYQSSMNAFTGKIHAPRRIAHVPFPLLFQVQALVMNNYLSPSSGTKMLDALENKVISSNRLTGEAFTVTVDSMKRLFQEIPFAMPGTEPSELDPIQLLERVEEVERDLLQDDPLRDRIYGVSIPSHQAWIFKAMVTPTRIVLHGPEAESKNRVLRKFPDHTDYFIRCLFCDDDGQDLGFNPKVSNNEVFETYRAVLRDGIQVAGRRYSFLGFSHSSLRSHSAWFMAPFTDFELVQQNCDSIIQWLGDFDDIRVPAKCAARIGQAFSETPYAIPIFDLDIMTRYIPDVKTKDSERVFSDGCGTMSFEAMQEFWSYLPQRSAAATCFQIRCGGVKGMISLDSRLNGKVICFRKESMMKFPSRDMIELGICDTASKPLRMMLNRQLIKILEDMGTPESWLLSLQSREVEFLRSITATASNTSTFLRYQLIGTNVGFPQLIRHMHDLGIEYRQDVFLRTCVEHVVLRELRLLKHKARIPVQQGVTLFGIMDETKFLEPDEIYVTFDRQDPRIDRPPRKAMALVTRSPALHPGDIRSVKMITPPENSPLRQLRNCVVFSQLGERDLPSQLSGGDLDGDLYNVIWDPKAKPKRQFTPADYPRIIPAPLPHPVRRDDIADFFINFMKTDVLGMIATRHQILADIKPGGTADPTCMELASLHSTAVDSSKTGIPVSMSKIPKGPMTRPDFLAPAPPLVTYDIGQVAYIEETEDAQVDDDDDDMGRNTLRYHRSEKILGKLYRNIDESKIWAEDISRLVDSHGPSIWSGLLERIQLRIDQCQLDINPTRQFEQAWRIRNYYESAITDMSWQFSDNPRVPISEVEVFCGFILSKRGSQTQRQRDSSIKLREEMDRVMNWIANMIRDRAQSQSSEAVMELSMACVMVGCIGEARAPPTYRGDAQLRSFKVLAACCLVREWNSSPALNPETDIGGGYVGVGSKLSGGIDLPIR